MQSKKKFIDSNGAQICMEIIVPDSFDDEIDKMVVIVTGDGRKGRMSDTWRPVIPELIKNNISVTAFDFFGLGESSGEYEALSLSVGIQNMCSVLQEIIDSSLQINKLGVIASSFGGNVALVVSCLYHRFDFMVLKSPSSALYEAYENEQGRYENMLRWKETGISPVTGQKYSVYLDALSYNVYGMLGQLNCKTWIMHGDKDNIVPVQQSLRLAGLNKNIHLEIIKGVGHNYKENSELSMFIELAIQFIKCQ